jgi:DNA-binding LytR/AlgR family response regulator
MLDIDYQKFDCDIFITELLYPNGKNGVKLAKRINAVAPSCKILFYANKIPEELDIYEANHVNCMLKGRHDARLVTFMNDLVEKMSNDDKKQFIKIRYDRNVNILDCRDIMYIKIENRVTIYYTNKKNDQRDGKYYEYRPLSEIMKDLPDNFVRCSAAAVVNRDYISNYNHQTVTMVDGEEIKIGRRYGDVNANRKEKVVQ